MPPRSFYFPEEFSHTEAILKDAYGRNFSQSFEKFRRRGRVPLIDENSLAYALCLPTRLVKGMTVRIGRHYRKFDIKLENKTRRIAAPRTYLKVIQWWILNNVLWQKAWPDHIHGFVPGRSPLTNARYHLGAKHLVNLDIADFFPSISERHVRKVFRSLGYNRIVSEQLSQLCVLDDELPQGAPTSPYIANYVGEAFDYKILEYCNENQLRYTRYADDLTISSSEYIDHEHFEEIQKLVWASGFRLNEGKTRIVGTGGRLAVTGIVINEKINMPRSWRKRIRAILHQARHAPHKFRGRKSELFGYVAALRATEKNVSPETIKAISKIPDKEERDR